MFCSLRSKAKVKAFYLFFDLSNKILTRIESNIKLKSDFGSFKLKEKFVLFDIYFDIFCVEFRVFLFINVLSVSYVESFQLFDSTLTHSLIFLFFANIFVLNEF